MELAKRIIDGKKPLDCFDTEIAKQFIGKKGYFSHYIDNYADLKNTVLGTLGSTGDTFHESFCCTEEPFDNYYYEFFLPAEWVKEEPTPKHIDFEVAKKDKNFERCELYGEELLFDTKNNIFYTSDGNVHAYLTTMAQHRYNEEQTKDVIIEKKYRPLSFKEFWRLFDFGDGVCFRRKGQDTTEFSMFLGYEIDSDGNRDEIPGESKVNLGGNRYTLAELFEYYEMKLDDEWQPFGIEVKEKE